MVPVADDGTGSASVGGSSGSTVASAPGSLALADQVIARLERLPVSRFHVGLGALLGVGTFFDAYTSVSIAVAVAVIFRSLHISLVNVGLLLSIAFLGQFVGAVLFGYLSEVLGRKPAFMIAMAIFGVFSLAAALSWSYQSLFWFRLLGGVGLGGEVPVAAALFSEYVPGGRRGLAVTVYETLFAWALVVTPLAGLLFIGSLGPTIGWRWLLGMGFIPVLWLIPVVYFLPESTRWLVDKGRVDEGERIVSGIEAGLRRRGVALAEPQVKARADVKATNFAELFSPQYRRRTAMCWIQWFMAYFISYGYGQWLPTLYVRQGLPTSMSFLLTALGEALALIATYCAGFALDSIGRKPVCIFGFAVEVAAGIAGFMLYLDHLTGWVALLIVAMFMLGAGAVNNSAVYVYTPELYPTRMRGWATTTASSLNRIASFIAPILVGLLLATHVGIGGVFLMFGAAGLVGVLGILFLGIETKGKTLEEISS
jgi:putative MFS transporter